VILVGGHVAALPERTLAEEAADFVASGEGPVTLADLVEALKATRPDLAKVRGLWRRHGGAIVRSREPAPLVSDLDREMPGVAWDVLPMGSYRAHNWHCFGGLERRPYAAFYTSLGCPYRCSFCSIQAPFREGELTRRGGRSRSYRRWRPASVIRQIDLLVGEYGVRNIKFADELFVLAASHVAGVCDAVIERGYDLNIWAYARVDTLKRDEIIEKLGRAGVRWLALGIESASERVLDDVGKGHGQDATRRAIERVRAAGINVIGNYMFGLPEDDLGTMRQTLELALELSCEFANFYCAMAYPGSELYDLAVERGLPLPGSWSGYSQYSVDCLPLPTRHVSAGEVLRFRDDAFGAYYSDPRYLGMMRDKFGEGTVGEIRRMASRRLERRYAAATGPR
jgi:radical SAM superfamily enzyme YgiQ (UPF0313 family)